MSLLRQKQNGFFLFFRILSLKWVYLVIILLMFIVINKVSFAGYYKEFNHLIYRDLRNDLIEDLWFGEVPEPNKVIYFLDEVASRDWNLDNVKEGSRIEILEYYRELLKKIFQSSEDSVTNEQRCTNIDRFIDQLKNTPGPYSFSDQVISKALRIIAEAKVTY